MAVPSSGTLTMQGLAQEALYGTYGSGTITSPIHLYDLVNGGNSAGSGNSYPTVNDGCTPNPITRLGTQISQVNLYPNGTYVSLYFDSRIGNITNLAIGDYLYDSSSMMYTVGATPVNEYYFQYGGNSYSYCSTGNMRITCNSSGIITSIICV